MSVLTVDIAKSGKNYPIFINNSDLSSLKDSILEYLGAKNYIVVINKTVYKLYSKILKFPKENIFIVKDGESQKNFNTYKKILEFALKKNLTREDAIIAIGGGVVGDLTGFVTSTYMRGISYIQVPTTLLACTDSSVGGKTAINTKYGKNLVGTFYQPDAVFINVNFLKTLNICQYKSGLGEVIKYGFIEKNCDCTQDFNLLNYLDVNVEKILERDILILQELIEMCIKLKIAVVQKDEKESNLRKILNLGHTYAHAIETITNYKRYTHGQCVIEGIKKALDISFNLNLIDKEYKFLSLDLIKKYGYKSLPNYNINKVLDLIKKDKKAKQGCISYVLPCDYAKVEIKVITFEQLREILC